MDSFRLKLILIVLSFGLVLSAAIGLVLYNVLPQYYPNWFMGIVCFFLVLETFEVSFIESSSHKATQRQLLNNYLLTKVIKMFGALLFIGAYALIVKEGLKNFALVFMIFYILFLFVETLIFQKIEKRLKEKNKIG